MPNKYTSRKFWTMVGSVALFTLLLVNGHLEEESFKALMYLSLGGYLAANVVQHIKGRG